MVDVAASYSHACAVRSDNTLWCWGTNRSGELGTGTTTDSPSPIQVSDLGKDVVGVTPGAAHTCARKSDGTLWCWGANRIGELGNGTTDGRSRPIQVAALGTSVLEVSADTHTCARKSDGTLWCWGDDYWGQLGDGRLLWSSAVPAQVALLGAHVIAVGEANGSHLCAIKSDGTLWCWGDNDGGRLGDGSTKGSRWPVQVSALGSRVVQVATGYGHTCAITSDARLWCWGRNSAGELGNGTTVESPGPVAVALEARVVQVTAGRGFTCARKNDNTLWCWGMDDNGEVGDGRTSESFCGNAAGCRLLPVQVGPPCDQSG